MERIVNKINELKDEIPIPEASYADLYQAGFYDYKRAKLTILWKKEYSRYKQIIILKKLYPKLKELSSYTTYDIVKKNKTQWQFAEMGWGNAIDFADKARKMGLCIIVEEL